MTDDATNNKTLDKRCGTCGLAKERYNRLWCTFPLPVWVHEVGARTYPEGASLVAANYGENCPIWKPRESEGA